MINIETGTIGPEEARVLKKNLLTPWKLCESTALKWVLLTLVTLVPLLVIEKRLSSEAQLVYIIIQQLAVIPLTALLTFKDPEIRFLRSLKQDIAEGETEVLRVRSNRVLHRRPSGDLGSGYYFEIDETSVLFLQGQHLDQLKMEGNFPSTDFQIIRTVRTGTIVDMKSTGDPIQAEGSLKAFTPQEQRSCHFDGQTVNCGIDSLLNR